MSDEAELARAMHELRATVETLRLSVDALVRRDVYDSDQRGVAARIDDVVKDVADIEKRMDKNEDNRNADRRLLIAAFVSPLLLLIAQLYLNSQGAG